MQNCSAVKETALTNSNLYRFGMQFDADDEAASSAESQFDRATEALRALVLRGAFALDVKLPEARVAEMIGVSRTPARLAMAALERDGLLVRLPRRGFRVRSFSIDEVVEAIEVRGELEAVAARVVAERGLPQAASAVMEDGIRLAATMLKAPAFDAQWRRAWCTMNDSFHTALVDASGMRPLGAAYRQVNRVPLASPRDTIFTVSEPDLLRHQLTVAHEDHERILGALRHGHSGRAAGLVREHAYRSGDNKRRNFPDIDMQSMILETPGIALVQVTGGERRAAKAR